MTINTFQKVVRHMLILMDGSDYSERLLDCSIKIFHNSQDRFNGAFVEGISTGNLNQVFDSPEFLNSQYTRSEIIEKILHTNLHNSNEFIERFVNKCEELSLKTKVYLSGIELNEDLVNESQYNDLFVIGKDIFKKENINKQSFYSIETVLRNTKCPILLLSCEQVEFLNIVLLYDGSNRSFEAIKLFMYLMADQMDNCNVILNIVVTENSNSQEKNIINYLKNYKQHFAINRVYPENYFADLLVLLKDFSSFLLVTGVNRNEIIEDLIFNKNNSFFMDGKRSIFLG